MLVLHGQVLGAELLPARGDFPPSAIIKLYEEDSGEPLNLMADTDTYDLLKGLPRFSGVVLKLRWRLVNLASLGGTGKGKTYRLSIAEVLDTRVGTQSDEQ
jgi:hypothetical protein